MVEHAGCRLGDGSHLFPGVPHESLLFGGHRVALCLRRRGLCLVAASVDRHKVLDHLPGRSPACFISSSGLTDTDAVGCSAGVRRPATNGIAANRLKVTAVSTAVTIRVTLRIGTSIKLPAGAGGIWRFA